MGSSTPPTPNLLQWLSESIPPLYQICTPRLLKFQPCSWPCFWGGHIEQISSEFYWSCHHFVLGPVVNPGYSGRHQRALIGRALKPGEKARMQIWITLHLPPLAQVNPSDIRKYQERLLFPPQTPSTHAAHTHLPPQLAFFFFAQETRHQGIYFNLTHHRSSLLRSHGLPLNITTARVFITSQQWDFIGKNQATGECLQRPRM